MNPKVKIFLRIFAFFILIFIAIQTYNRFCLFGNNCQPFYFTKYFPRTEGSQPINIEIKLQNYRANLDFYSLKTEFSTVSNRLNTVTFIVKNTSDKPISFRPKFKILPEEFSKHVTRLSCLCSQSYTLKPKEKIKLNMEFFLKPSLDKVPNLEENDNTVEIIYSVD